MNKRTIVILAVILVLIVVPAILAIGIGLVLTLSHGSNLSLVGGDQVALIRVEGVITSDRGGGGLFGGGGGAGAEHIVELLEQFRKDDSVKSGVLRINSPGGSAAGSQEVYQEIMKCRKSGKKLTVSMGDVAASGGYYIASAADRILADQATLTGSIGVIMHTADLHELYSKIGISMGAIKTGPYKDIGSSDRPMTPQEKQLLQNLINDVYNQFITDVSNGRHIPVADVRKIADGRIFTGSQAVELKLVDQVGTLQDALKAAAKDAGIKGEFEITEYEREKGVLDVLMGDTESSLSDWLKHSGILSKIAEKALVGGSGLQVR